MPSKLGHNWLAYHKEENDFNIFQRWQPRSNVLPLFAAKDRANGLMGDAIPFTEFPLSNTARLVQLSYLDNISSSEFGRRGALPQGAWAVIPSTTGNSVLNVIASRSEF